MQTPPRAYKRKPPRSSGVHRERATGVEPATSSLGRVKRLFRQVAGNQRKRRESRRLGPFCFFPDCPEKARLHTKNQEPFRVECRAVSAPKGGAWWSSRS